MFKTSVVNTIYWCSPLLMWDHTDNFCGFPLIQKWTLTLSQITPIYSPPALAKSFWCCFGETKKFKAEILWDLSLWLKLCPCTRCSFLFLRIAPFLKEIVPRPKRDRTVSLLIQFHRIFFIFLLWSWCSNVMF